MSEKRLSTAPVAGRVLVLACFVLGCVCLVKAVPWSWSGAGASAHAQPAQARLASGAVTGRLTKSIEQIQVGERVAACNPQVTDQERAEADAIVPADWCKLTLQMTMPDGSTADLVLLRPAAWLEAYDVKPGATVELDLAELGINGPARVLTVAPCPPIKAGSGEVVTGTFARRNAQVVDLYMQGQAEPIGVTAGHLIWSEDRQDFVPAGQLKPGERLAGLEGPAGVAAIVPRAGPEDVFNIEVDSEHVYRVGMQGLLVHNTSGISRKVIVGETMARVEAAAAKRPGSVILNNMPDFAAQGLTGDNLTSAMMQYNRKWILEQMRSGRTILDIGRDVKRMNPSIFYEMEQNMLKNYQKLHPEWTNHVPFVGGQ